MVDLRPWPVGAPGSKGRWQLLAHRRLSFLVPISLKLQVCDLQPWGRRNCSLRVPWHRRLAWRETLKQSLAGASYPFHQLVFILLKWCSGPTSKMSKETKSSVLMLLLVIFWVITSYSSFHSTMLTSSPTLSKNVFTWEQSQDVKRPRLQTTLPLVSDIRSESPCLSYRKKSTDWQNWEKTTLSNKWIFLKTSLLPFQSPKLGDYLFTVYQFLIV